MLYCFGSVRSRKNIIGSVRSGENIIGSVQGRGNKICYFSVRSGSGQMVTGHYGVGVPKTLPRRTLLWIINLVLTNTARIKWNAITDSNWCYFFVYLFVCFFFVFSLFLLFLSIHLVCNLTKYFDYFFMFFILFCLFLCFFFCVFFLLLFFYDTI